MPMRSPSLYATLGAALLTACSEHELARELGDEADDESRADGGLFAGVNGDACLVSPYNCKLRVSGGNRIATHDDDDDDAWGIAGGVAIRDGNGDFLATSTATSAKFNYGQVRSMAGEDHAFAMSTSNGSAGWLPIASILGQDSFVQKVGHVSAKSSGLDELACYEVRNSHDTSLELKKVVYDSTSSHERAGDYLPLVRNNGLRSVNLTFNVPGFALGGVAVDHFPAGTKFQRLDVPTDDGAPSIDIPLYVKDDHGRYRKKSGTLKFVYGTVIAATGTTRNGWMAYEALKPSSGCGVPEGAPAPTAQCYARCCNGVLQGPELVADADACHDESQSMCDDDDHVLRSEIDGVEVWERPNQCWAKCNARTAYHALADVDEDCTAHADAWCDEGDRGGLEDAAWSRCEP